MAAMNAMRPQASTSDQPRIGAAVGAYPPGPAMGRRFLNGQAFRQNAAEFMLEAARFGDLVHYKSLGKHIYQFHHPALIEDFFLKDAGRHHRNIVMQRARAVLGHGLLTSEEPLHMRQRRLAQPAFHRARIAAYADVIAQQSAAMTTRWVSGEVRDLREEMLAIALRIVGKCLFDLDVNSDEEVRRISHAVDAFMGFLPLAFLPFPELLQRLPLPSMRRIRTGREELDALIYGMIAKRRGEGSAMVDRGDLLSMLMVAVDTEDAAAAKMTDVQLRDECITILLAGHETTANGLSFALWLLARHPEVQQQLREEARAVLGDRLPTAEDYGRLRYAQQVFAEAMRLYPPVWVTARTCVEPYEVAGFRIPRGAVLLAPQFVVHRDPRYWDEPERFDPTRFSDEKKSQRPRYAYFPFAGGGRQCIGEGLAWMEGVFVLAMMARDWRLTLPAGAPQTMDYNPSISMRPRKGVLLLIERIA